MPWFDSLFSDKKRMTSLKKKGRGEFRTSTKSYQDIKKRPSIDISSSFSWKKHHSFSTLFRRKTVEKMCHTGMHFFRHLGKFQIILLGILLVGALAIYGYGLQQRASLLRNTLLSQPMSIFDRENIQKLESLSRELTLFAPIIDNPLIPIEPISSYVTLLDQGQKLLKIVPQGEKFQKRFLAWGNVAESESIFPHIDAMYAWLADIDPVMGKLFTSAKNVSDDDTLDKIHRAWNALLSERAMWEKILGKQGKTRILLLNQNSDELRAGGGFPGTAFIVEFYEGKLTRFQLYDIYALDWKLKGYRPSPEGINRFRSLDFPGKPVEFEMRDANYFPSFSESAQMLDELAQESGLGKLDLVIGINQKIVEDLIQLVEPLRIPGVNVPIDHNNAILVISMLVEGKITIEKIPKNIIQILVQTLGEKIQSEKKQRDAGIILLSHLFNGEIVAGSSNPDIQTSLEKTGLFDAWQGQKGDWIYPIFTSISRNKSDRIIERTFIIQQKGSCLREVTLKQKHWFDEIEDEKIRTLALALGLEKQMNTLLPIQGKGDNVHYLRFIVPLGSKLIRSDADFTQGETGKEYSTIHGYVTVQPNSSQSMTLEYELPQGHCSSHTAFIKQSGLRDTQVVIQKSGKILYQKYYE